MARIARKADGRRIFSDAFKRRQMNRVWSGEVSLAELSRRLGIARSLLQRWKRQMPDPAGLRAGTHAQTTPVGQLNSALLVRELQLLVGKQTLELELLRTELAALRKRRRS
jgi:transposase-like protein